MLTEFVRTVRGDVAPGLLGMTYCHDHLIVRKIHGVTLAPRLIIDDYDKTAREIERFRKRGGSTIVDAQPFGAGRDVESLCRLSGDTGVHIVASTGFHKRLFYPDSFWSERAPVDEIAALFVSEIEDGAYRYDPVKAFTERSDIRAGVIKVAADEHGLDSYYTKIFSAAAIAHRETGAPILTHTELSALGLEQARLLIEHGVRPECIIISHMDRVIDIGKNKDLAGIGVFLDYDTIAREKYHSDEDEVALIKAMAASGYGDRVVLGMDSTRERLAAYGGAIGLDYIITVFQKNLLEAGIDKETVQSMLMQNPQAALTFTGTIPP